MSVPDLGLAALGVVFGVLLRRSPGAELLMGGGVE